jgi:O-antigen/teichoic acid export membrane protein
MLGPVSYGILATLTSIIYIFSVPTNSIQTVIARYAAKYNINNDYGKIKAMFKDMIKKAGFAALLAFIVYLIVSIFIKEYVKIPYLLLVITGIYLFGAFISPAGIGILQGMKKFWAWGWNSIFNSIIKIIISVILVFLGFEAYGPILGFLLGVFASLVIIFPSIKEVIHANEENVKISLFSKNDFPLLLAVFVITLMYTLDIIFAKIFFSPEIAGRYSVISMIGKMIFFASSSISSAMFPLSSEKFFRDSRDKAPDIAKKTFIVIGLLCLVSAIASILCPEFIIKLLFGSSYLQFSKLLIFDIGAFSLIALTNTIVLYKLSINELKMRHSILLLLFLIIQIGSFLLFNNTIQLFGKVFFISSIITFLGSVLFIRAK